MSERFLCGDPEFTVSLVMDDGKPLLCTAIHVVNKSAGRVDFICVVAGKKVAIAFDPNSDTTWTLPAPVPVETLQNSRQEPAWRVAGLTSYYVRQGSALAAGMVPADLDGDVIANATSAIARDRAGRLTPLPGTLVEKAVLQP